MARQREFDPGAALQTAIALFWEKGYYDTSVDEVVKQTGVAKYGIYGTFGTKRELFRKALSQYASDRQKDIQRPIRKPDAALPEVFAFFKGALKMLTAKDHPRGCLIANTGIELGLHDPEIGAFVKAFYKETTTVMARCLERAVEQGQLVTAIDITALASYLVTEFRTMLMLTASGHTRREVERHMEVALQVLR